jgi:hypothetical protein
MTMPGLPPSQSDAHDVAAFTASLKKQADRPARQPGVKPGRRWTVQSLLFCLGTGGTGNRKISWRD